MSYATDREAFIARIVSEVSNAPRYSVQPHASLKDGRVYIHDATTGKSAGPDYDALQPGDAADIAAAMNAGPDGWERKPFGHRTALARLILRDATTHNRCAERECSEDMRPSEAARVEKQSAACERRITERLALLGPGFSVAEFSGDPRGATVKIRVPSGYGDSWGDRSHLCVPVRS